MSHYFAGSSPDQGHFTVKKDGHHIAILPLLGPKMNNLRTLNWPPFYIAYSNLMNGCQWLQATVSTITSIY